MERPFELGDKVIITGNTTGSCNRIGDISIVAEEFKIKSGYNFRVNVPKRRHRGNWTWCNEMKHFIIYVNPNVKVL